MEQGYQDNPENNDMKITITCAGYRMATERTPVESAGIHAVYSCMIVYFRSLFEFTLV